MTSKDKIKAFSWVLAGGKRILELLLIASLANDII
jgi:hypothetical protein